jgi:hypothetical protein
VPKYATHLASLGRGVTQWRTTALVLAGVCVLLAIAVLRLSGDRETVLIPWAVASAGKVIHIGGTSAGSQEYLQLLAQADLSALLDWQPQTVGDQISGFLARLSPQAYAQYNLDLRHDAEKYRKGNLSEAFYLHGMTFLPPNRIRAEGTLMRWAGGSKMLKTAVVYTLTYAPGASGFSITGLEVSKS